MTGTEEQPQPETTGPKTENAEPAEADLAGAAPAETRRASGFSWPFFLVLALLVAGLGAGALTWPQWRDRLPGSESSGGEASPAAIEAGSGELEVLRADLAATRERVRQLEIRLGELARRPEGGPMGGPMGGQTEGAPATAFDPGPLASRLSAVETAIADLKARPDPAADRMGALESQLAELRKNAADAAAVLHLSDRVERAETQMREIQGRRSSAASLLLAVGLLRDAVEAGRAFEEELRAAKALAPEDADFAAALERLKPHAAAGIPARRILAARFEALAPRVVRAEFLPQTDGWWRQALARVANLVSIRREDGSAAGESAPASVARAQAALSLGDLAGAAAEIGALVGAPADEAAAWLADARARLEADKSLSELAAQAVASAGPRQ